MEKELYIPIDGFFDLRKFDLTNEEFNTCYRVQKLLNRYKEKQNQNPNFKINNKTSWSKALALSAELQSFLILRLKKGEEL